MKFAQNKIGHKFHQLTIIDQRIFETKHGLRTKYLYKCNCNTERWVSWNSLKTSKSCGCYRKAQNLERKNKATKNMSAAKFVYKTYKRNARRRGIDFVLTLKEVVNLITKPCQYCNEEGSNVVLRHGHPFRYNGIDRFYSDRPYELKNTLTCCKYCNMAKGSRDPKDFEEWAKNLYWQLFEGD